MNYPMTLCLVKNKVKRFLLLLLLLLPFISMADDFPPKPSSPVVDYTGTLSNEQIAALVAKINSFQDSTSNQIAVVIMKTIGDNDVNEYAAKLGNYWGVGQKGKNNGIVILLAMDVRHVGIQIGKGLEGAATDGLTGEIIRKEMVPYFKQGDYYTGIDNAVSALMKITTGEYKADQYMGGNNNNGSPPYFFLFLIVFILLIIFLSRAMQVGRYARMNSLGFWAAWALMNAASNRSRGSWGSFSGGGGFGGGFGGGGGGGFGGLGGGSFGGGGAGGSW
jgi:uncharacterized protein